MDEMKKLFAEIMELSEKTADLFYQMKIKKGQENAAELVSSLNYLYDYIEIKKADHRNFNSSDFREALSGAVEALRSGDYVLFADYLHFEIAKQIGELL